MSKRGSPFVRSDPGGNGEPVLRVAGLSVSYGQGEQRTTAVREVSFDIGPGEILGLVGESGSGKSSVCGALMRLLPRSASMRADQVTFGGTDLTRLSDRAMRDVRGSRLSLIPQKPMTSLSPTTPIARQLRWYLGEEFDKPETRQLIIDLGLRVVLDRPRSLPSSFSGGQLQRLLILIAALVRAPALVLADEPTTTLDATVQAQVLRLLLDVRGRVGAAMLYVSHDLAVITQISDRVGVMYGGRLVEVAPVGDLFGAPRHPYTKALIATMPASWRDGEVPAAIGGTSYGANRLPGCPFAPRCPVATGICHEAMPEVQSSGSAMVRCHQVSLAS